MSAIWASVGLRASTAVIEVAAHRGPDGSGWQNFDSPKGPVVLAHQRLATLDTALRGREPMFSDDDRYCIILDGCIHNYRRLGTELEGLGWRFATKTDSEVLLAAFVQWGEACLDRLQGMFAFVIYDQETKVLFAARDRLGMAPLYIYTAGEGVAIASEIKQFAQLPQFDARLNFRCAADYFGNGVIDRGSETLFRGVKHVRPGHSVRLDLLQGRTVSLLPKRWCRLPPGGCENISIELAADNFDHLLTQSIADRMIADVPVGAVLTPRLDSLVLANLAAHLAAEAQGVEFPAYAALFQGKAAEEEGILAEGTLFENLAVNFAHLEPLDILAHVEPMVWYYDEPFADPHLLIEWETFRIAARAGLRVMLSHQGSDELFGNLREVLSAYLADYLARGSVGAFMAELRHLSGHYHIDKRALLAPVIATLLPRRFSRRILRRKTYRQWPNWLSAELSHLALDTPRPLRLEGENSHLAAAVRRALETSSLPMALHYSGRAAMANGIELRYPYLDQPLVDMMLRIAGRHTLYQGETLSFLRQILRGHFPDRVVNAQIDPGPPLQTLFWHDRNVREWALAQLRDAVAQFPTLFDWQKLGPAVGQIEIGHPDVDPTLWRIVTFAVWTKQFRIAL